MSQNLLFDVVTPLGFMVRVAHTYWELIVTKKYPTMKNWMQLKKVKLYGQSESI